MNNKSLGQLYLQDLEAEAPATRKCIERVPENLYDYKPHEKSMQMGYLTLMLAEIPKWITHSIEQGDIDFGTWEQWMAKTTQEMLGRFDENIEAARRALSGVSDEALKEVFRLKNNGQELMAMPKDDNISSSIRHWVHHRGQLTIYMRLNNISIPSIYGPSADDKTF